MKQYTQSDIRALRPCYTDEELATAWGECDSRTLPEILSLEHVPVADRVWVGCRLLDPSAAREFAVDCAERALSREAADCAYIAHAAAADAAESSHAAAAAAYAAAAAAAAAAAYATYGADSAATHADSGAREREWQLARLVALTDEKHI